MELPSEFRSMLASLGSEALAAVPAALLTEPSVSVRCNPLKDVAPAMGADIVPWCPEGIYLSERPAFTFLPAMHQGLIYVQDASSMFISHVIRHLTQGNDPVRYLDACAAPGGKTTAAIAALPRGSIVVANEYVPLRAGILRENLAKWGYPLCCVTQGDTSRFTADSGRFDIIAADVPCSGEGMMRKDPHAVEQWSPALVEECAGRQRQIVDNLWPALAPGGYFIYSTCTFNTTENERMAEYIAGRYGAEPVAIPTDPSWGIHPAVGSDIPAYRFLPGSTRGEGLFMTVLRKPGLITSGIAAPEHRNAKATRPSLRTLTSEILPWLRDGAAAIATEGDRVIAIPETPWSDFPYRPRIHIATIKGRGEAIPEQALATSMLLADKAFPRVDVTTAQAVDYLRCEALRLDSDTPRGIVLLTHGGHPLGFAKNIGQRANNLYPKPWRIISQAPQTLPHLPLGHV